MVHIRAAAMSDYPAVRDFYQRLIIEMVHSPFSPCWEWDVYPTQEMLTTAVAQGELFVAELDGQTVACMVVNHEYNDGYNHVRWSVEADDEALLVIHALGVLPAFSGRGIAKELVRYVIALGQRRGIRTIRLDVLGGNLPAEKTYTSMGFVHLDTIQMFYEDTGWTDFKVYEYVL